MILDRRVCLRKMPNGRIYGVQAASAWTTVEIGVCSLDFVIINNSDGKTSLNRPKSPETTTDTEDVSKFYQFNV